MRRSRHITSNPTRFFKRTLNLATAAGCTVDGTIITKASSYLAINFPAGGSISQVQFGSLSYMGLLSDMPSYTEFTTLFDRYKICGIKIKFTPFNTSSATVSTTGPLVGGAGAIWHSVIDYDDATLPTASDAGIDAIRQYPSYKMKQVLNSTGAPMHRYFKPRLAAAVYSGAFTSYANMRNVWIDAASPSVQYYGLKAIVEAQQPTTATATYMLVKAEATIYFAVKDPR